MQKPKSPDGVDHRRRRFFGAAALTVAAAQLGALTKAAAETNEPPAAVKPASAASFAPLKRIDAGLLNVAYAEAGPADGPPVILLHGWPYDIYSYVDVAPILAASGYREI